MPNVNVADLWPSFDDIDLAPSPSSILKEAAVGLAPKTKNLVEARVRTRRGDSDDFDVVLSLFAPVLNYSYGLLVVSHGIDLWPAKLTNSIISEGAIVLEGPTQLRERLTEVFRHPQTAKIIRSMISQSKEMGDQVVSPRRKTVGAFGPINEPEHDPAMG